MSIRSIHIRFHPLYLYEKTMAIHSAQLLEHTKQLNRSLHIAIVRSEFNTELSEKLLSNTLELLEKEGFTHIDIFSVPWAFEIPALTSKVLDSWIYTLVITLWVVIKWSTPHFDYICTECLRGLMDLSLNHDTPVIVWVLTCDTYEQAKKRANNTYAIYALNYLTQRTTTEHTLNAKRTLLMENLSKELTKTENK